ncbi:SDR family oxidoreductase [Nocardioides anomalus]|uniref:SDR family oxidoreductase n=1 Tax=Nocardioides anomalus TaxID=2712223 RepID=A0A6G6WEE9_9ACTN|nr:SDR family NAD(P)-dependent oxidoreductase [Nocardioides anomalus]QIG43721.1 SDR family oxidoreductase [Nocardioides anomalus]
MRTALITGASRGIGRAVALSLAASGFGLTVSSRRDEDLVELAAELRAAGAPRVAHRASDLTDLDSLPPLAEAHERAFGAMSVLVLNAGMAAKGAVDTFPLRRFERTLTVNLTSQFVLTAAALPLLRRGAAADPEHGARVVAVSSLTGRYAEPGLAAYAASKAALTSFVETLNLDEAASGVTASAILPGYVDTDMTAGLEGVAAETMIRVGDVVTVVDMLVRLSRHASITAIPVSRSLSGGYRA